MPPSKTPEKLTPQSLEALIRKGIVLRMYIQEPRPAPFITRAKVHIEAMVLSSDPSDRNPVTICYNGDEDTRAGRTDQQALPGTHTVDFLPGADVLGITLKRASELTLQGWRQTAHCWSLNLPAVATVAGLSRVLRISPGSWCFLDHYAQLELLLTQHLQRARPSEEREGLHRLWRRFHGFRHAQLAPYRQVIGRRSYHNLPGPEFDDEY